MPANPDETGVGPTEDLSLRVSAAVLVRVVFPHPDSGQSMLALERKAAFQPEEVKNGAARVIAQPFGGGVRIVRPDVLLEQVGNFHYDSLRSREEQDFRILIRPNDWERVKQFSLNAFRAAIIGHGDHVEVLEASPARELSEEFEDTLQVALSPAQYRQNPLELLVENEPVETVNLRAVHLPTVRIYAIFEAALIDSVLIKLLLENSADVSDRELAEQASLDAQKGGRGRTNAALAIPIDLLRLAYLSQPPKKRGAPMTFQDHLLEGNVSAVVGKLFDTKYERFTL